MEKGVCKTQGVSILGARFTNETTGDEDKMQGKSPGPKDREPSWPGGGRRTELELGPVPDAPPAGLCEHARTCVYGAGADDR